MLSIGSNLENRIENIIAAINFLSTVCKIKKKNISSFYETEPYGNLEQNWFINITLIAKTDLTPENLLFFCKSIEFALGRKKSPKWTERIIDIDILLYDNLIIDTKNLKIPHKYMHKRKFVLEPATEIGKNIIHPQIGKNISELLNKCEDSSTVKKIITKNKINLS